MWLNLLGGLLVQEILSMLYCGEPFIWFWIWHHPRMELFKGYITLHDFWWECWKLATLSHNGGSLVHQFPCFPHWAGLTVTKNRIGPQRQAVPVPGVGDKGYPVTVVWILFSAHRDIYLLSRHMLTKLGLLFLQVRTHDKYLYSVIGSITTKQYLAIKSPHVDYLCKMLLPDTPENGVMQLTSKCNHGSCSF